MNVTRLDFAPALQTLLTPFAGHPLLERLLFASLELAVLAVLVFAAIRIGRIRSPRLTALLWLLVLGKPLFSLAIGSPFHLFRMEVPTAVVVVAPAPLAPAAQTDPQPSVAMSSSSSIEIQSPPEPIVLDEELAGAPFAPLPEKATPTPATPEVTPAAAASAPPTRTSPPWSPATWILGIWLTGVACFAGLSLVDRARAWRLVRAARKPEPSLSNRYSALAANMGLKRPAALRITDEMESPALVGSIFSTIVIPGWLAEDANEAKLDWALRHELMHFRLRDPWAALVRELSQMLFYFHPVAWWAGAKWKTATEKACDRAIVADEAAARDYAEQLYRILVGIHGRRQAALRTGLFATRTQIGQRIAALLHGPRTAPHLSAVALVVVAGAVTAVTLSVGGAFADKNAKRDERENTPAVAATDQTPTSTPADSSATPTPSEPDKLKSADETFTYAGTVVDEKGKPVAGAKISIAYWSANRSAVDPPALAISDAQGRFQFSRHGSDFSDAMATNAWASAAMFATKEGRGFAGGRCIDFETSRSRADLDRQRRLVFNYFSQSKGNVLRLVRDDFPIDGQLLDTEGQPVAGALVETINVWQPGNGSLDAWEAAAKQNRHLEDWSPGGLRPLVLADELTGPRSHVVPAIRTDATGTFTLSGLGRERIADIVVSAPGIESIVLRVRSRPGDRIKLPRVWLDPREPTEVLFYPCDFRCVAGPSVPIEGRVIDAKSGQPLAGCTVRSESVGSVFNPAETTTDADGHYRLLGSALGQQDLVAVPPPGSRYFPGGARLTTAVRQKPAVADIRLSAGVLVQGRVTEHGSGKPISGRIRYFALRANPHLGELAHPLSRYSDASELQRVGDVQGRMHFVGTRRRVDKSGIFSVPVIPGKGILAFGADDSDAFPWGIGADRIDGEQKKTRSGVSFDTVPFGCESPNFNLLTAINVEEGAELRKLDLTLVSALTLQGRLRAPDGRVLSNYSIYAQRIPYTGDASWFMHKKETFEVQVYPPDAPRRLMFYQPQSNLVGWYDFTGEPTGPLDITLKPAGRLTGRVVDKDGQPMGDVSLVITSRGALASGNREAETGEAAAAMGRQLDQYQIMVDKAGRFELRGVFPGVAYSASLPRGPIFTNMTAQIGETKDLGDLRIGAAVKAAAEPAKAKDDPSQMNAARRRGAEPIASADTRRPGPATAATADAPFTYAGTVVDDHGKPVAGVQIDLDYLHASNPSGPVSPLAVTDSKGRFEFSRRKRDFAGAERSGPWSFPAMLVATKPGYGPAGRQSIEFETTGRLVAEQDRPPGWHPKGWSNVLKLAFDDVPIHGRILDTEGRPVVGALVETINLWEGRDGSLDTWEAATRRPGADLKGLEEKLRPINFSNRLTAPYPTLVPAVRTDASGSFTLAGLGRERLADLAVSAPGIETTPLHVRTRRGAVINVLPDNWNPKSGQETFYPCDFTRVAGPSVTVEGQVTDGRSHRPLAGIRVHAARIISWPFRDDDLARRLIAATTDAGGHYRLEGLPPGFARLGVIPPPGSRYLMAGVDVRTVRRRSPVVADIKLAAGVMVRGRVTDSRTGFPEVGGLQYFAFRTNPHLRDAPGFGNSAFIVPRSMSHYRCDADGRFEVPVLPGRGILAFRADVLAQLPRGIGAADIDGQKESGEVTTVPFGYSADWFHLLTPLDPQPGADSLALDLTVRSPAVVTGAVRGPDGKLVRNYRVFDESSFREKHGVRERPNVAWAKGATFETYVYSPDDHHLLVFNQRARNLAGIREFTGEPSGPLDITLERCATLKGRVVDEGGQPLADVSLVIGAQATAVQGRLAGESREAAVVTGRQFDQSQMTSDKDGRFEVRGAIPGLSYSAVTNGAVISGTGRRLPGGTIFSNILAQAGETKELGDLRLKPPDAKAATEPSHAPAKATDKNAASGNAAPGKSRDLQGIVVNESGAPVRGALVTLRTFQDSKTVQTAADGRFSLDAPKPFSGGCLLAADASGGRQAIYEPNVDWAELAKMSAIRVVLKPAREIPVTVNDASGRPVSGAVVAASAYLVEVAKETSDKAGRTVLRVPADAELQSVFAVKPEVGLDYFSYLYPGQIANSPYLLPRGDARPVKFVLSGAKTARLRFVDGRQRPLPGLRVSPAFFQRPRKGSILNVSAPEFKQTTDANGVATFRIIPADNLGFVEFGVSTQEYALHNQPLFDPNWTDREITWILERKQLLRGSPDAGPAGKAGATKTSEAVATAPTLKPVPARRTTPAAATSVVPENPPPAKAKAVADVIEVHGRVFLPDGKPAAGAKVFALHRFRSARAPWLPLDKTTASADGAFMLHLSANQPPDRLGTASGIAILADRHDGFGPVWRPWASTGTVREVVLKLVADSPIHGRIVDLEGKPVRGARVSVLWQGTPVEPIGDWLAALKAGDDAFRELRGRELAAFDDDSQLPAVTDNEGRFTIKGIGADCVARLELRGETVAYAELDVVTRPMQPLRHQDRFGTPGQVFGSEFTYQAAPTQPLVGTVRDAATGAPLANVSIESRMLAGAPHAEEGAVRTRTDSQGHYRLVGLQKGNGEGGSGRNIIAVVPNDDQPYFMLTRVRVPKTPGLAAATLDFKLTRGLWITGRAIDRETGKPVPCAVVYAPFLSNPLAANLPEFKPQGGSIADLTRHMAQPDGTFRLVGLPGRGLVAAKSISHSYRVGAGAKVDGMTRDGRYPTYLAFETEGADVAEEINPAPGTESVTRDLVFERGRTIRLSLVDGGGKPAERCVYVFSQFRGAMILGQTRDGVIEMTGMAPHESRPLLINEPLRHLGKVLVLHEDDKSPQTRIVTLEPCATVKGRLLDADGVPLKNARFSARARGGDGYSLIDPGRVRADADGSFELSELPPGGEFYSIHLTLEGKAMRFETIAEKVVVSAGKTIDLGVIKLKRDEVTVSASKSEAGPKPVVAPAKPAVADVNVVHGRVLLPDGRPAAGAKVFALRRFWSARVRRTPLDKTTANADGTFVLRFPKNRPYDGFGVSGNFAVIAAQTDGFGPDWQRWLPRSEAAKEVVLKLVADSPIHGRIVDLEGKPVAGVQVSWRWQNTPRPTMATWLAAIKSGDVAFRQTGNGGELPASDDDSNPPVVTDSVGHFTIKGIGADRVARLELRGETIAYAEVDVVNRAIEPIRYQNPLDVSGRLFGSDFTYQAAPTQPLVGTVRDAASGAPLAGVRIESRRLAGAPDADDGAVRTQTDAQGRYRLVGLQKANGDRSNDRNVISVIPNDEQPYFMLNQMRVPQVPGLAPATLDFKLTRGLWITGRATDKVTGKPVPCRLIYAPFLSNPLAANLPEFKGAGGHGSDLTRYMARPDGTFRLVGLPGRGLVAAKSMGRLYSLSGGATDVMTKNGKFPTYLPNETAGMNVVEEINPAPGTESVTRDLVFNPGRTVRLSLVDAGGKPVGRCLYAFSEIGGGSPIGWSQDAMIEMAGMAPHESRHVLIHDRERHLGKVITLHDDEKAPQIRTVTLEPCATLKGRFVDADGVPVKNVNLEPGARGEGYWLGETGLNRSDADGKFQLDLPPGAEYYTIFAPGFRNIAEKLVVSAGKTIDLGAIKVTRQK